MKTTFFLLFILPILSHSQSKKTDDIPSGVLLGAEGMSVLEMNCHPTNDEGEISCEFNQKSIWQGKKHEPPKLQAKDLPEIKKEVSRMCKTDTALNGFTDSAAERAYLDDAKAILKSLCDCQKSTDAKTCLEKFAADSASMKAETCKINIGSFEATFRKIGPGKYMNNPGPRGICKVVNVMNIEKIDDYGWEYRQSRASIDKSIEICKAFEVGVTTIYRTALGGGTFKPRCKYIDLASPM